MSALRLSRPGYPAPTFDNGGLVYLGPSTPRKSGHNFYLLGELTQSKPRAAVPRIASVRTYEGQRCGYILKIAGVPCFRPIHDGSDHRSAAQLQRAADRKRKPGKE